MHPIELNEIAKRYRVRQKNGWQHRLRQVLGYERPEYLAALQDITLNVEQGEIFGILGPNGAGKTTLIKIIAGLLLPEHGTGYVNGYDVLEDREKLRTSVNILMSAGWVIFDYKLSVYQNLRFWGMAQGISHRDISERITEVLTSTGLADKLHEFPENLSAGMRQKMNLARCLLSDRPIYLLDEPTANIDPYSANFIRQEIEKLRAEGKTILLATHNLWEAEALCDRIAILNRGKIIALDRTSAIKKRVGKDTLVLRLSRIDIALVIELSLMAFVDKVIEDKNTLTIYGDVRTNLFAVLKACENYGILDVDVKEASLNDIFLQLITGEEKAMVMR